METLVVEFTMGDTEGVEERPNVAVRPVDDWRDKQAFLPADTTKHTLAVSINDGGLLEALRLAPSLGVIVVLAVLFQSVEVSAEFPIVYFHLVASCTP